MSDYSYQTLDTQDLAEWVTVWPKKAYGATYELADRSYGVIAISSREPEVGVFGLNSVLANACSNDYRRFNCAYFDKESLNIENSLSQSFRKLYAPSDVPCNEHPSDEVCIGHAAIDLRGVERERSLERLSVDLFAQSGEDLERSVVVDDVVNLFERSHGFCAAPSQELLGELLERYAAIGYVQEYHSYSCYAGYLLWARSELLDVLAQRLEQAGVRAYGQQKSIFQWVGA
tara:strand:- start:216470 stop:217162 length:693 start_codon:yes stop_codon:yes gene_type:complete